MNGCAWPLQTKAILDYSFGYSVEITQAVQRFFRMQSPAFKKRGGLEVYKGVRQMSRLTYYVCRKTKLHFILNVLLYFFPFIHTSVHSREEKLIFKLSLVHKKELKYFEIYWSKVNWLSYKIKINCIFGVCISNAILKS